MGQFTKHQDEKINEHIGSRLQSITHIILDNIPDVKSILLTGGFGKGEGSIKISEDGEITCLRDFDMVVIVERFPREKKVQELYDRIYLSLGSSNPENMLFRFSDFVVDIKFLRKKDLIYPDVWFVDLKVASKLLYGNDIRNLIPWSEKDIPLSSGLRILFEKTCGLLGLFDYRYLETEEISEEKRELFIVECFKTFVEICTALCILAGRYKPKYAQRAKIFKKIYFDSFPDLAKVLPDLPKKVARCTSFKLNPDFTKIYEDPIELWFSARDYLGTVLQFYILRYLGIATLDWSQLSIHTKNVARHYYTSFLDSLIYTKLKLSNRLLLELSNILYQTLTNLEYAYVVTRNIGKLYLRPLNRFYVSPSLKFFQAGIMLLFSLNKNGTIEKPLFKNAIEELRHCVPVEISTYDASRWNALRRQYLKAYSLYRGYHFVK